MTYDVEIGDSIEQKELPFVAGVVGDFSGASTVDHKRLKERKFVSVDNDNFDEMMSAIQPRAVYRVPNQLSADGGEFAVDMTFRSMDDFRPEAIVQQVEPLKKLLDARARLADLRNKLAGNEKLEDILMDVLNSTEKLNQLGKLTHKPEDK